MRCFFNLDSDSGRIVDILTRLLYVKGMQRIFWSRLRVRLRVVPQDFGQSGH